MKMQTGRVWAAVGLAVFALPMAHAEGTPKPSKINSSAPAVVVKIGDALLEEYHGGNPVTRTTIIRGKETASTVTMTKPVVVGKKRS